MKKILALLLLVLAVTFVIATFSIDRMVKNSIETIGSEMTGTSVTVDRVSISPLSGNGTIYGFRVANPDDFGQEDAISIGEISISLDLWSIFSDEIVINELIVDSPSVYVEQQIPDNNLQLILTNVKNATPEQTSEKGMVIDYFVMRGGSAELYTEIGGERTANVEISEIELRDIGRGGVQKAVNEAIEEIVQDVVEQSLRAAAQSGTEQIRDAIRSLFE